jgi:DNA-binding transcriptional regulator YiaG
VSGPQPEARPTLQGPSGRNGQPMPPTRAGTRTIEDDGCFALLQDSDGELLVTERHTARGELTWRIAEVDPVAARAAIERLRPSHNEAYHGPAKRARLNLEALVALRTLAGMSQAELARRSGLSQGHISELERGDKTPREITVKRLANALGVSMTALLTR